jgi:protein required for attachment to host cells
MNIWVVCGSQSGAKVYSCSDLTKGLQFVANFPHPEGRLREHELVSDYPGTKSGQEGPSIVAGRHAANPREDAKNQLIEEFAHDLSKEIDRGVDQQAFDGLIVCADPKFLGRVRSKLSKRAERLMIGSLNLNFYNSDQDDLLEDVRPIIQNSLVLRGRTVA